MFSDPEKNIEQFGLMPGMHVADLGSGSGFYTIAAARAVSDSGRVYSVDIQKDLLAKTKSGAEKEGIHNIEVIWGDLEKIGGSRIKEKSLDAAIISNILFLVANKSTFIKEVRRILKPKGKVLVIDWEDSFGGLGPHPDQVVGREKGLELFKKEGFVLDREIDAGSHHYGFIFNNS